MFNQMEITAGSHRSDAELRARSLSENVEVVNWVQTSGKVAMLLLGVSSKIETRM